MATTFDIGPLSWVRGEIDLALAEARALFESYGANPADFAPLKICQGQLHQVSGALQMVGLDGAARFSEAFESLLAALLAGKVAEPAATPDLANRATFALTQFLDDVMERVPTTPLKLFPLYRELHDAAGNGAVHESDLFYPDLSQSMPVPATILKLSPVELAHRVAEARIRYQRGLLLWLRQSDAQGAAEMLAALQSLESVQALPAQRMFWKSAAALAESLLKGGLPADVEVKQLCARIDLQLRRLEQGKPDLAGRLVRDVLYSLARSKPVGALVDEIKRLYRLDALLPVADAAEAEYGKARLEALLRQLQQQLAEAKRFWLAYAAGSRDGLRDFNQELMRLKDKVGGGNASLSRLFTEMHAVAAALPPDFTKAQPALGLEIATALLLAESIVRDFAAPSIRSAPAVDAMLSRLHAALRGEPRIGELSGLPLLDEAGREAQDKLLLSQVAHEIRVNLAHIEQVLDAFFRNPQAGNALPGLQPLFAQILGAFDMLGLSAAAALLRECRDWLTKFGAVDYRARIDEFELLAEGLSSIGFYLEALEREQPDAEPIAVEALRRMRERVLLVAAAAPPAAAGGETEFARHRQQAATLLTAWRGAPQDEAARTALQQALDVLSQDAELAADKALAEQTATALQGLRLSSVEATALALDQMVGTAAATPTPQGVRLAAAAPEAVEAELLEIYLEEAYEVLAAVADNLNACRANSQHRAALAEIRRGFHTLKGSGRTIGLMRLGEAAWQVEQVLNRWLEQDWKATPALLDFIERAHAAFGNWTRQLKESGSAAVDDAELVASADSLRGEEPVAAAGTVPSQAERESEVRIGEVKLPAELYQIFTREARQHFAVLEQTVTVPDVKPSAESLRAAHTLAGIARTAGFAVVAELAAALEQHWQQGVRETAAQRVAVTALDAMLAAIERRQPPQPDAAALKALQLAAQAEKPSTAIASDTLCDTLDQLLLPVFLTEAEELLSSMAEELGQWRKNPSDSQAQLGLRRALHTLKSSARTVGALRLGEQTHGLEARVLAACESSAPPPFQALTAEIDRIAEAVERLRRGETLSPAAVPVSAQNAAGGMLRVRIEAVDKLVSQAGEVSIARARIANEMHTFRLSLAELNAAMARLSGQLRELEIQAESQMQSQQAALQEGSAGFDPLEFDRFTRLQELTRFLAESANDVATVRQSLLKGLAGAEAALAQQARLNRNLQHELMHLRMVPFAYLSERLQRSARLTAQELGKAIEFEIRGGEIELDRGVLEKLVASLEHLLRNAVAHGIELPAERGDKPQSGQVLLDVRQVGKEIVVAMRDDGRGLDLPAVRAKSEQLGLVRPGDQLSEEALRRLIFIPGVTTANQVTAVSGRGIGMHVVKNDVAALGGRVEVASRRGAGTAVTLHLPLTLAVTQVVLARAGESVYALPTFLVEQLQKLKSSAIDALYAERQLEWHGQRYPFHYLPHLFGDRRPPSRLRYNSVLLMSGGERRVALHVDEILGHEEAVVKPLGPQLSHLAGISGATVLGNGKAALIVDPLQLLDLAEAGQGYKVSTEPMIPSAPLAAPTVMIVDDSLTVRKVTSRFLIRAGYQVTEARDGVEAIQMLHQAMPDVMLLDIEMPRMDGFELTRHLRSSAATAHLPIIMITSRTADKHRSHALALGANVFLGKPYQEEELLAHIASFAARATGWRAA